MQNHTNQKRTRAKESGVALVIAIIALLIVTAVAAGMIIMSNSEVAIDANYRDEQVALFAAKAGLQEARDRMLAGNANPLTLPTVLPGAAGVSSLYITSTGTSPWLSTDKYYDTEFMNELGTTYSGTWYSSTATNTNYSGSSSNALPYRWVRINLKVDSSSYTTGKTYYVDGTTGNAGKQVLFDWSSATPHECVTGTGTCLTSSVLKPVYEITSYAVTTNGTHRMLQDEVTARTFNLSFPAALTLPGPIGSVNLPNSSNYCMDGNDTSQATSVSGCSKFSKAPAISGCSGTSTGGPAIGLSTGNDSAGTQTNVNYVDGQVPRPGNFIGSTGTTPSVSTVSLPADMSTPAQLDATIQTIEQNTNICLAPSSSATSCPNPTIGAGPYSFSQIATQGNSVGSASNPQVVYVDGDMDISGNTNGYGILVVTGNLTYDGNSSWNGIILVVGNGTTTYVQNGGGNGQFNGALLVATTKDSTGKELSSFGPVDFNINGGGGNGLYYNSCWINYVQSPVTYQLLSSKEISK